MNYVGLFASTILGLGIIFLYFKISTTGFVWFGVSAILSYMAGLGLYAVQNISKLTKSSRNK